MSKIEHNNEGKHGTITNGAGQTLTGKVTYVNLGGFDFLIDNNKSSNAFNRNEWDFVPDKESLPVRSFAVIRVNDYQGNNVFVKTQMGWHSAWGTQYETESVQKWAERAGFDVLFEGIA